jgi:hypothetical protein
MGEAGVAVVRQNDNPARVDFAVFHQYQGRGACGRFVRMGSAEDEQGPAGFLAFHNEDPGIARVPLSSGA